MVQDHWEATQPDGATVVGYDGHVVGSRDTDGGLIIEHQHVTNALPPRPIAPGRRPVTLV